MSVTRLIARLLKEMIKKGKGVPRRRPPIAPGVQREIDYFKNLTRTRKGIPVKAKDTIPGVNTGGGAQMNVFKVSGDSARKSEILNKIEAMRRGTTPSIAPGMQRMESQAFSQLNQPGSGNIRAMFRRGGQPRTTRFTPDPGSFNEMTRNPKFAEFLRYFKPGVRWTSLPRAEKVKLLTEFRRTQKPMTGSELDFLTRST